MKTGILTFHNPANYGAAFQAYALWKTVSEMPGQMAEIIDYENPQISAEAQLRKMAADRSVKGLVKKVIAYPYMRRKQALFQAFLRAQGCVSQTRYVRDSLHESAGGYDTVVFGSDQVWNLDLTGQDWNYFGAFSKDTRKVAYAASVGSCDLSARLDRVKPYLESFAAISCREQLDQRMLEEKIGIAAEHVLDPTFLLPAESWRSLEKPIKVPEAYILLYLISPQESDFGYARELSEQTGLPILYVNYSYRRARGVRNLGAVSPENFLYLLDHARYMVTNSFHGTALSINLQTDFYCQLPSRKGRGNARAQEVLERLGLTDRCLYDDSKIAPRPVENWEQAHKQLALERQASKQYLYSALEMQKK